MLSCILSDEYAPVVSPAIAALVGEEAATRRDARRVVAIDVAARDEGTEAEMPMAVIISATNAAGDTRRVSSRM